MELIKQGLDPWVYVSRKSEGVKVIEVEGVNEDAEITTG